VAFRPMIAHGLALSVISTLILRYRLTAILVPKQNLRPKLSIFGTLVRYLGFEKDKVLTFFV
jgi:hypothetical protein